MSTQQSRALAAQPAEYPRACSQMEAVHSDILQQHREQQQQVHTSLAAPFGSGPLMLLAMPSPILPGLAADPTLGSAPLICNSPHHMHVTH